MLIRKAKLEDTEKISEFNIQMAKETEEKILDKNIVQEGIRAVLNNKIKGFYLVAEDKATKMLVGQLMVTFEWSDGEINIFGGYRVFMLTINTETKKFSLSFLEP